MSFLAKAISSGSLQRCKRKFRCNLITAICADFTKVIGATECDDHGTMCCSDAFEKAVETAYKAVMKPKEGTILTVAKGASDKG